MPFSCAYRALILAKRGDELLELLPGSDEALEPGAEELEPGELEEEGRAGTARPMDGGGPLAPLGLLLLLAIPVYMCACPLYACTTAQVDRVESRESHDEDQMHSCSLGSISVKAGLDGYA